MGTVYLNCFKIALSEFQKKFFPVDNLIMNPERMSKFSTGLRCADKRSTDDHSSKENNDNKRIRSIEADIANVAPPEEGLLFTQPILVADDESSDELTADMIEEVTGNSDETESDTGETD